MYNFFKSLAVKNYVTTWKYSVHGSAFEVGLFSRWDEIEPLFHESTWSDPIVTFSIGGARTSKKSVLSRILDWFDDHEEHVFSTFLEMGFFLPEQGKFTNNERLREHGKFCGISLMDVSYGKTLNFLLGFFPFAVEVKKLFLFGNKIRR